MTHNLRKQFSIFVLVFATQAAIASDFKHTKLHFLEAETYQEIFSCKTPKPPVVRSGKLQFYSEPQYKVDRCLHLKEAAGRAIEEKVITALEKIAEKDSYFDNPINTKSAGNLNLAYAILTEQLVMTPEDVWLLKYAAGVPTIFQLLASPPLNEHARDFSYYIARELRIHPVLFGQEDTYLSNRHHIRRFFGSSITGYTEDIAEKLKQLDPNDELSQKIEPYLTNVLLRGGVYKGIGYDYKDLLEIWYTYYINQKFGTLLDLRSPFTIRHFVSTPTEYAMFGSDGKPVYTEQQFTGPQLLLYSMRLDRYNFFKIDFGLEGNDWLFSDIVNLGAWENGKDGYENYSDEARESMQYFVYSNRKTYLDNFSQFRDPQIQDGAWIDLIRDHKYRIERALENIAPPEQKHNL